MDITQETLIDRHGRGFPENIVFAITRSAVLAFYQRDLLEEQELLLRNVGEDGNRRQEEIRAQAERNILHRFDPDFFPE